MKPRPDPHPTLTDASFVGSELPILSAGPLFWRSLEERAENGAPRPDQDQGLSNLVALQFDPSSRREFLRLMAASLALGGLSGCAIQPTESIVPYVEAPEQIVPGKPLFFSTAVPMDGFACGVLVESHMGRPTKIEGNPDHPASLGATDAFAQAAISTFYDPDRSQVVTRDGRVETWEQFQTLLLSLREEKREKQGRRPADPDPDDRLADAGRPAPAAARAVPGGEMARLRADHTRRRSRRLPAGVRRRARAGLSSGQGRCGRRSRRRFPGVGTGPAQGCAGLRRASRAGAAPRDYILGRRSDDAPASVPMNRLYAIECTPTITGAAADHRLAIAAQDIAAIARAIAGAVGVGGLPAVKITLPDRLAQHDDGSLRWRAT